MTKSKFIVYVVERTYNTGGWEEVTEVVKVFSSEEKANDFIRKQPNYLGNYEYYEVEVE